MTTGVREDGFSLLIAVAIPNKGRVYDLTGRQVVGLKPGVYFVFLGEEGRTVRQKILMR